MNDSLLLSATRVLTFQGGRGLTNASGFLFQREERLFLVTSRHVVLDEPTEHHPDRLEIEFHIDPDNMARSIEFSIPLYQNRQSVWREGRDSSGQVDIAVIELESAALPEQAVYRAFTPEHLEIAFNGVELGSALLIVGFPLGFQDVLHHMPVARHAIVASSFGLRFQGHGYFLTDARTHRGSSGAPVVMRVPDGEQTLGDLPWKLLGVHSARLDLGSRDGTVDEALGLNCAWYADILLTLTDRQAAVP